MPKESAGILLYRVCDGQPEVFLMHPGGPFWAKKDAGVWTIPKGEIDPGEEPMAAAVREFKEETSFELEGPLHPLGSVKQASGKIVHAWACCGDCDPGKFICNTWRVEWPPKSGKFADYPELDRADWFSLDDAAQKLNPAQAAFLPRLRDFLASKLR